MKKAALVAVLATVSASRADDACTFPEFSHEVGAESPAQLFSRWNSCHPQADEHHLLASKNDEAVRATFAKNAELVFAENAKHAKNGKSMRLGLNEFAGLTNEEWNARLNLQQHPRPSLRNTATNTSFEGIQSTALPAQMRATASADGFCGWPRQNHPAVKNQGACGSCYAFGAGSALEGAIALWNHDGFAANGNPGISEAQMLACCAHGRQRGCNGGMPEAMLDCAWEHLHFMETEEKFPYDDRKVPAKCPYGNPDQVFYPAMGPAYGAGKKYAVIGEDTYEHVLAGDHRDCSSHYGLSITVALDAGQFSFQLYSNGVYEDDFCSEWAVNHAVAITGFGTENGTPYWDVRNSWGSSWGNNGYIKMKKGANMCGIGSDTGHNFIVAVHNE